MSGADIEASYLLNYCIRLKQAKLSLRLSFRWSAPLVWYLGPHSCIFDKLSREAFDLNFPKM